MNKKIICIIPARSGSKGVPGKNIKLLGGIPLVSYTIEFAKKLGIFETICLTTDSEEIRKLGLNSGIEVPFLRPDHLSQDNSSSLDFVIHAIDFYKSNFEKDFEYVCLLQPTVPFRDSLKILPELINLISQPEIDTVISFRVVPHKYNPEWMFEFCDFEKRMKPLSFSGIISRRQDLKSYYFRDGSIYLFKTNNLKYNSIYGNNIYPIILNDDKDINIDTIDDWESAEKYLKL